MKRRIGIIQLLLFGFVAGAGVIAILGSGGSGGGGGGATGILAKGGKSGAYAGADGGTISIYMAAGKGDIVLGKPVSTKITIDAPTQEEIDAHVDFGSDKLTINADATFVGITSSAEPEPASGTYYMYNEGLWISDGDGTLIDADTLVTGVEVAKGATLTIGIGNNGQPAYFWLDGSLVNNGTIKGAAISIEADLDIVNQSGAKITTAGLNDGDAGGNISLWCSAYGVNLGTIDASGAAGTGTGKNGGDAGKIAFGTGSSIVNTGTVIANGGNSTDGAGGNAHVDGIALDGGTDLQNSAAISAAGGKGPDGGGNGGLVDLYSDKGNLINTGNLDASGGNITSDTPYEGGAAGDINLTAWNGSILTSGRLNAKGGSSSTGSPAGAGGDVYIAANRSTVSGNVEVSGAIDASGGDSRYGTGGDAGTIVIENNNGGTSTVDHLEVSLGTFDISGSSGPTGGAAQYIEVEFEFADNDGTDDGDNGEIINAASLIARGGDSTLKGNPDVVGDGAPGVAGGSVDLVLTGNGYEIVNTGKIDVSGGDSIDAVTSAGKGGNINMNSAYHIDTGASLIADGGADTKGQGGDGGRIELYADADLVTGGSISADGGRGTTGGNGGLVYAEGGQTVGDAFIRFRASASADGAAESGTGGCVSVDDVQPSIDAEISGTLSADGAPADSLDGDIYEFTTYTQESYLGAGQVCNNFF